MHELGRIRARDDQASCALANLRKASRVMTQLYDEALTQTGLRCTQFSLLATVVAAGAPTVSELAEEMVMDRTTLARNLRPLQRQGLLRIEAGQNDQRERIVTLTERGERAVEQGASLRARAQHRVVEHLGEERFRAVLRTLNQLVTLGKK